MKKKIKITAGDKQLIVYVKEALYKEYLEEFLTSLEHVHYNRAGRLANWMMLGAAHKSAASFSMDEAFATFFMLRIAKFLMDAETETTIYMSSLTKDEDEMQPQGLHIREKGILLGTFVYDESRR